MVNFSTVNCYGKYQQLKNFLWINSRGIEKNTTYRGLILQKIKTVI